jgi:hypothetical protein
MPGLSINQTSETSITYLIDILSTILNNTASVNSSDNSTVDISLQNTCNNTVKSIFQELADNGYSNEQISNMFLSTNLKSESTLSVVNHRKQHQAAMNFVNSGNKYGLFDTNEFENVINDIHSSSWNRDDVERDMEKWLNELSS